jgi:hypothetical protein
MIMRSSILAAGLGLSVRAGVAGSAPAVDEELPRNYWEQQKHNLP